MVPELLERFGLKNPGLRLGWTAISSTKQHQQQQQQQQAGRQATGGGQIQHLEYYGPGSPHTWVVGIGM